MPSGFNEVLRCVRIGPTDSYLGAPGLTQATVYGLNDKGVCRGQTAHFFEVRPDSMQPDPATTPTLTACDTGEQLPVFGLTVYDLLVEVADPDEPK